MSFKLSTKPQQLKWTVPVRRPHPTKAGIFEIVKFQADFVLMGQKEFDDIQRDSTLTEIQKLRKFMTGWDLQDENGNAYDFQNDDVLEAVLNVPYMPVAILKSYADCITGGAASKNS